MRKIKEPDLLKRLTIERKKGINPLFGVDPAYVSELYQKSTKRALANWLGCNYSQLDAFLKMHSITKQ